MNTNSNGTEFLSHCFNVFIFSSLFDLFDSLRLLLLCSDSKMTHLSINNTCLSILMSFKVRFHFLQVIKHIIFALLNNDRFSILFWLRDKVRWDKFIIQVNSNMSTNVSKTSLCSLLLSLMLSSLFNRLVTWVINEILLLDISRQSWFLFKSF